jgi:L,D-peptidoglycan transpeptidase YkuD (ErfK/YbiS/YcfS/YnhG family)
VIFVDTVRRRLTGGGLDMACEIGRGGAVPAADKREGDGATPLGDWRLRTMLLRPGTPVPLGAALPWRWIAIDDGWSDDPADPAYNRPVTHPHPFSAERLWRVDGAYDMIVTLNHNDLPVAGMGSAVFLHCFEGRPTAGCVAVAKADLLALLGRVAADEVLRIV